MRSVDGEALAALSATFGALGTRWYLFGAQAAIVHGVTRFTEDVDVTVDLGTSTTRELVAGLKAHGFELRISDEGFVERTRVLPIMHTSTGMLVDVVIAGPGIEDLFFEGVVNRTIDDVEVPVASAEDIIVMKILAARPRDLEDVEGIVAAQGSILNVERIRSTLRLLEDALDQSDLLPAFEAIYGARG